MAGLRRSRSLTAMNNRTATPARASQRARRPVGAARSGRLTVGDYMGQPAADAAQAVRCAGLKPGLDRSFGCEPELFGQVVAQQPEAGSDLARNGMVTLYVAAPGAATGRRPTPSEPDPTPAPRDAYPDHDPLTTVGGREIAQHPGVRRRRKPGLATRAPTAFDIPASSDPGGPEHRRGRSRPVRAMSAPTRSGSRRSRSDALVPPDGEQEQSVLDGRGDESFA